MAAAQQQPAIARHGALVIVASHRHSPKRLLKEPLEGSTDAAVVCLWGAVAGVVFVILDLIVSAWLGVDDDEQSVPGSPGDDYLDWRGLLYVVLRR